MAGLGLRQQSRVYLALRSWLDRGVAESGCVGWSQSRTRAPHTVTATSLHTVVNDHSIPPANFEEPVILLVSTVTLSREHRPTSVTHAVMAHRSFCRGNWQGYVKIALCVASVAEYEGLQGQSACAAFRPAVYGILRSPPPAGTTITTRSPKVVKHR